MNKNFIFQNKKALALTLISLLLSINVRATVWPIPNTAADTLENFFEQHYGTVWQPGDTIMLSDASSYTINGTIDIFQEVTLMGDPSLPSRPILHFYDDGLRPKEDTISVIIKNLNVNGFDERDSTYASFLLRMQIDSTYWKNIIVEDVEAWSLKGLLDLDKNKQSIYDSIIVNNVICHDFQPNEWIIDPNINYPKYLAVTNSTFYNIPGGFLKNPCWSTWDDRNMPIIEKKWIIDHNTFYKVGGNNNCILQQNDPTDGSVDLTFTNNIVSQLFDKTNARPFRINVQAGDFTIAYSVIHDYDVTDPSKVQFNFDNIVKQPNIDTMNIYRDYPGFSDSANYNFTISAGNPLLEAGTDGGPIGDPRWASDKKPWKPGANCHLIPNTSPDTLENFIENFYDSIWYDGDTIVMVSNGEYKVNGTIDIFGEVTILGDFRLNDRPILHLYDNGFRAKEDTISVIVKNINVNGYDERDTTYAPFLIRMQIDSTYWKNIIVEDVEAWSLKGLIDLDQNKQSIYDSVIVNNVICHDFQPSEWIIDPNINYPKYLAVTNSTFYNIPGGFLKNPCWSTWDDRSMPIIEKKWIVDHNTFFKVGGNNNCLLQQNDPTDGSVDLTFTNNIVSRLFDKTNARPFRINEQAGVFTLAYSVFHDYDVTDPSKMKFNFDTIVNQPNIDTMNISRAYPEFADTTNGNFRIPDDSPLYMAATDGGAIGDPRWAPFSQVKTISIEPLVGRIIPGQDHQLAANVNLPDGADKTVSWSVENGHGGTTGAATIDANGLLSTTAVGDVKVIATSNYNSAFFDTLIVTIVEQNLVTSIVLSATDAQGNPSTEIKNPGNFLRLAAVIEPGNADDRSIEWSLSDDTKANLIVKTATTAEIVAVADGTVDVMATANDGSGTVGSISITMNFPDGVENISSKTLQIVPNPASDFIQISSDQVVDAVITNLTGAVVMSAEVYPNEIINISELNAGIYIVTVKSGDVSNTIKLIIE